MASQGYTLHDTTQQNTALSTAPVHSESKRFPTHHPPPTHLQDWPRKATHYTTQHNKTQHSALLQSTQKASVFPHTTHHPPTFRIGLARLHTAQHNTTKHSTQHCSSPLRKRASSHMHTPPSGLASQGYTLHTTHHSSLLQSTQKASVVLTLHPPYPPSGLV